MTVPYSAGAICSTVEDFYKWDQALYSDALVKQKTLNEAFQTQKLNDGTESNYGFGWRVTKKFELNTVSHIGGITGFNSCIVRYKDLRFTIVVFCNSAYNNRNSKKTLEDITKIYLSDFINEN